MAAAGAMRACCLRLFTLLTKIIYFTCYS